MALNKISDVTICYLFFVGAKLRCGRSWSVIWRGASLHVPTKSDSVSAASHDNIVRSASPPDVSSRSSVPASSLHANLCTVSGDTRSWWLGRQHDAAAREFTIVFTPQHAQRTTSRYTAQRLAVTYCCDCKVSGVSKHVLPIQQHWMNEWHWIA